MYANVSSVSAGAQIWGFDPLALLSKLEFPNDRDERRLQRFRSARLALLAQRLFILQERKIHEPKGTPALQSLRSETPPNESPRKWTAPKETSNQFHLLRFAAAVMIQALYRGWNTRRKYLAVKCGELSLESLRPSEAFFNQLLPWTNWPLQESLIKKFRRYCRVYERVYKVLPEFPDFAASYIQSIWRTRRIRKAFLDYQ
jgi:hypothetical protein